MIDGSEKRKRQLVFELQSSRVYEKCSKTPLITKKYFQDQRRHLKTKEILR